MLWSDRILNGWTVAGVTLKRLCVRQSFFPQLKTGLVVHRSVLSKLKHFSALIFEWKMNK